MSPESSSEDRGAPAKLLDRTRLAAPLRREVTEFAKRIRRDHGPLDRGDFERLTRLLRSAVVVRRRPGRKTSPEVLKAVELRAQKTSWSRIYGEVFPGYWGMDLANRHYRSHKLRDAVRAYLRRRRSRE